MNDLLAQFVSEARDLLQEAGEDLLVLERTPDATDSINRLFRSVHTLKGSSGLFDVQPLTKVLHAAEDIFQAIREHGLAVTPSMVDLTLRALDQVGQWIEQLDRSETLNEEAGPLSRALVVDLRTGFAEGRAQAGGGGEAPAPAKKATAAEPALPPPDLAKWFSPAERAAAARAAAEGEIHLISYLPEDGCFFRGEDPLHLALQIPQLQSFAAEPRTPWAPLSGFDPFACNLAFHALSAAPRPEIEALFRYVPDQVTIRALSVEALTEARAAGELPAFILDLLRDQIALLGMDAPPDEFAGRVAAAALVAANVLRFAGSDDMMEIIRAAGAEALEAGQNAALRAAIANVLEAGAPRAAEVAVHASAAAVETARPAAGEQTERTAPRTLRVDQEKVDALMNLVGELVVAKNSLPFLARRAETQYGLRELGREIKDQYGVIDRIAQELQSAVMSVRMMPVGQVFQRLPRLVRDLSRKLGKQVDLVIEGEETEADKNVIESLFDPLLHMVRNSLDHGVETPQAREACGKAATATVKLLARHEADQMVIEVIDDGRGIDPNVIKRKAYERGLIDEARLAAISDQDAAMLIFSAGFSTAETISDVSGRGVGMDVVRNVVEKAGGRIAMTSVINAGTTVRLHLPLSMAVSRVMTVGVDDRLFGIAMNLIHGTVKVPQRDISRIKGGEAFVLRDRVVPIIHLARLLNLPDVACVSDEISVLVVRVDGHTIGLGLSAFGEVMEVILKPLEGMLAKISGYSGTALLGDGRVLLVLDLKELLP